MPMGELSTIRESFILLDDAAKKQGAPFSGTPREMVWTGDQSIALKLNSPPSLMPENQRAVTVLVLV